MNPAASVCEPELGGVEVIDGQRSGREARLDLLLAEELAADPGFAAWFLRAAGVRRMRPDIPDDLPCEAAVRINLFEDKPPIPPEAFGETDIDVVLKWDDGFVLPVLVEDKVWAPFQPRQPQRYVDRACIRDGVAVLVAPAEYMQAQGSKAALFHGRVTVEAIIKRLRSGLDRSPDAVTVNRRRWRADLLVEIISRRPAPADHLPTVEFTQFCTDWLRDNAPSVIAYTRSLHTEGQGWLDFEVPVGLLYKVTGWTRETYAAVDLYVANYGFAGSVIELDALLAEVPLPTGFVRTVDKARPANLVLRFACAKADPSLGCPTEQSRPDVVDALDACRRISDWLQMNCHRLAAGSRP